MRLWRAEVFWLILVAGVLALWWLPGASSVNSDSYSVAFRGKKVLYQTLQRLGDDVQRSTNQLVPRPWFGDRILILGPARYPTSKELTALYNEVLAGGTLIVAASLDDSEVDLVPFGAKSISEFPKRPFGHFPLPDKPKDSVDNESEAGTENEPDTKEHAQSPVKSPDAEEKTKRRRFDTWNERPTETRLVTSQVNWRTQGFLEFSTPDWEILVTSGSKPQVARKQVGSGTIVLSSSDDIFSNGALTDPNRALLAFRILESAPGTGSTWFDETLNGSGVPKVVGILFDPLFRPMTLQCFLILAMFGWMGSFRFGPIRQVLQRQRRSIVEHAQAVGVLYFRAAAGSHAVRALHEFLKLELRRIYGSGFRVDNAEAISRAAQANQDEVRTLLNQISAQSHSKLSTVSAGRLLRSLSQLISKIRTKGHHSQAREGDRHNIPT